MITTLITGAGGPSAMGFLSLLRSNADIHMADMSPHAPGLFLVDPSRRHLIPAGKSPEYAKVLLSLCLRHDIRRVVVTCDAELVPLAKARTEFQQKGVEVLVGDVSSYETCIDKLRFYAHLHEHFPCPHTVTLASCTSKDFSGAVILKPRIGSGSRGIQRFTSVAHLLDNVSSEMDPYQWLVQDELPGDEYSIDVYTSPTRGVLAAVPRHRIATDSGIATVCRTVKNPTLSALGRSVAQHLGIPYIINVQAKQGTDGTFRLLEVNARPPGTLVLTAQSGPNMAQAMLDESSGRATAMTGQFEELVMLRRWSEQYLSPAEFNVPTLSPI